MYIYMIIREARDGPTLMGGGVFFQDQPGTNSGSDS